MINLNRLKVSRKLKSGNASKRGLQCHLPHPPPPPFIVCKCYVQVHHFGGKDNYLYFALKRPSIIFRMLTNGLFHQYHRE